MLGGILLFALTPGFILVPLHHWSLWRRLRHGQEPIMAPWSFRSAWLVLGMMLVLQFLAFYFFNYDTLASWITPQQKAALAQGFAAFALSYAVSLALLLGALILFRKDRLRLLGPGSWSVPKTIGQDSFNQPLVSTGRLNCNQWMRGTWMSGPAKEVTEKEGPPATPQAAI